MIADLTGRTALVTGGAQGVGRAICLTLAEQGADVAVGDVRVDLAAGVAAEIEGLGRRALALELDVRSAASAQASVRRVLDAWGKLDILVNNAGVVHAPPGPDGQEDPEAEWDHVFAINLRGVVNCCDAVMPHMAERRYGKIVNIGSTAGKPGDPLAAPAYGAPSGTPPATARPPLGASAYGLSKAAVIRHTQLLSASAARINVNVNCVCPSRMITPLGLGLAARGLKRGAAADASAEEVLEARRKAVLAVNRFGRELEPIDVAKMVAFLASDDAKNITGQSINVDGGFKLV
jgi:NAD(P)-dependent dehydrogenase (short-subunit alcohol dehydrogenase family)